jgi:hypothetical protein
VVKALRRTVPGSIPGGVTGFFSDIFHSDRTMALGSTQPLVKMSTRNIPGGKGGRCLRLRTSPSACAECHEIWDPKLPGTLWATLGLLWDSFPLPLNLCKVKVLVRWSAVVRQTEGRKKICTSEVSVTWSLK